MSLDFININENETKNLGIIGLVNQKGYFEYGLLQNFKKH